MKHAGKYGPGEGAEISYILTPREQKVENLTGCSLSIYEYLNPNSIVAHFLQKDYIYSNKVTRPNSANPFGGQCFPNHYTLPSSNERKGVTATGPHTSRPTA